MLIACFNSLEREKAVDKLHVNPWNVVRPEAKSPDDRQDRYVKPFARDTQKYAFFNGHSGENRGSAKADIFRDGRFGRDYIAGVVDSFKF